MKKVYLLLLFVFGFSAFAQQKGISYQAVIINPNVVAAPGYNGTSIPLANKAICLSFKIVNSANQVEYQESQAITTDGYGMVNVVIGTGTAGTGLVSTLEAVAWYQGNKKLVVGVNTDGVCSNYTEISNQVLNYTPYSFYAQNADLKDGYVTTAKLADAAVTDPKIAMGINPAKVGLGNVNNTSDANKPVSTATQTALDLKENLSNKSSDVYIDGNSTTKYPTVKAVKDYVDANSNSGTGTIVDADANTKGKIQLAGDLAGTATAPTVPGLVLKANTSDVTTSLASKEDVSNKSNATLGTSTTLYPTQNAVKAYVDTAITGATIVDADTATKGKIKLAGDLAGTADLPTVPGLALKANTTDVTTFLGSKEDVSNKSNATLGTSTTLYPTQNAVKAYVDTAITGATIVDADTATKGKIKLAGDLAGTADLPTVPGLALKANTTDVTTSLALKANLASPTFTGTVSGIDKTMVGLSNVDNTTDASKPVSTATQTALDLKADTADVTTSLALKANLASPTFTGTVSGIDKTMVGLSNVDNTTDTSKPVSTATQTALDLKANLASPTFTGTVTAPIYASTPQTLTDAATIAWDPVNGLNASVTLGGNRTLSFTTTPTAGSYGTLVVTQDATGGRTITLPSTANKILGSTSTTTIALSSAANAKDILNFYYDGTNCYWNIGQGYGTAATSSTTNLASSVTGTLAIANGGTGASTKTAAFDALSPMTASGDIIYGGTSGTGTRLAKGTDGQVLQLANGIPAWQDGFNKNTERVAFGAQAGMTNQGIFTTAVGPYSGILNQGDNATALGRNAGNSNQGGGAVAIGLAAAEFRQGSNAIAIGSRAGNTDQHANSIVLNATGADLNTAIANSLYVAPIRDETAIGNILVYNTTSKEITVAPNFAGGRVTAKGGSTYNDFVGFSFNGGDWAKNTGMFSDNPDSGGSAILKFRIATSNSTANSYLEINPSKVSVLPTTTSTSKTTGALTVAGGLGVDGNIYTNNLNASGTVTAGTVTYPNIHNSTAGQVLTVNAAGTASWSTPAASGVPYSGASGPVNLGAYNLTVNGLTIGQGARTGNTYNTAIGVGVLPSTTNGSNNTGLGYNTLASNIADNNVGIGFKALYTNSSGGNNIAIGKEASYSNSSGNNNVAIGFQTAYHATSDNITAVGSMALNAENGAGNTAIGAAAGKVGSGGPYINTTNSTFLGYNTTTGKTTDVTITNATAIGYGATVSASHNIQLGNSSVTKVNTSGALTTGAVTYPIVHGTANQVLSTTGSGTLTFTTPVVAKPISDQFTATAGQTVFTLTQTPITNTTTSPNVKPNVWMFINGVRTNNLAYTISGATVTYSVANNNSYTIVVGDRVQFDYSY
jgi:hypothetical protein